MRSDNSGYLARAARARSEATRTRALAAIAAAERSGAPITLTGLARNAGVSRAWFYAQPGLRSRLQPLLTSGPAAGAPIPDSQRASDASLRSRLMLGLRRNQDLTKENAELRNDLENALARLRSTT